MSLNQLKQSPAFREAQGRLVSVLRGMSDIPEATFRAKTWEKAVAVRSQYCGESFD